MTVLISTDNLKEELGMEPFPANPVDQHARFMAALCEDFSSPEFLRTGRTPNADRVAEIARQTREKDHG